MPYKVDTKHKFQNLCDLTFNGKISIGTDFFEQRMRMCQSTETSKKRTLIVDTSEKQMSTTY